MNFVKNLLFVFVLVIAANTGFAYKMIDTQVTIGSNTLPDPAAVLQLESSTGGFLPSRVTTIERDAFSLPVPNGLIIYNSTTGQLETYGLGVWTAIGGGGLGRVPEWTATTIYIIDSTVHYNNKLYKALTNHTSGATFGPDLAADDWVEMSMDYLAWETAYQYKVGNIVHESNHTYVCSTDHVSGVFATDLAANWTELSDSDDIKAIVASTDNAIVRWDLATGAVVQDSTVIVGDTGAITGVESVTVGGALAADSLMDVTSTLLGTRPCPTMTEVQRDAITTTGAALCVFNTDQNKLNIFDGTTWVSAGGGLDAWQTGYAYRINDVVHYVDRIYRALTTHTSGVWNTDLLANEWVELSRDINLWSTGIAYKAGNVIIESNHTYRCIVDNVAGVFATDLAANRWLEVVPSTEAVLEALGPTMRNPTGFELVADQTLSFVDGTRTFTIAPTAATFSLYVKGKHWDKTSESIVISDVSGLHFIYYDVAGVLQESVTYDHSIILEEAIVAVIYWNVADGAATVVGRETHGYVMSPETHKYLHWTVGTKYMTGLGLSDFIVDGSGDNATDAQFSISNGSIADEDLTKDMVDDAPQDMAPTANFYILYRSGANGYWSKTASTTFGVTTTGTGRAAWNEWTGATWQLSEVNNRDFTLAHIFASNDENSPMFIIMGQNEYTNVGNARIGAATEIANLALNGLPTPEMFAVGSIIYQTRDSYGNAVKSRVRSTDTGDDYVDFRFSAPTSSSPTSHGTLNGLANDDHLQYPLLVGRPLGQTIVGGSDPSENLTLSSTSDATKGSVFITDALTVGQSLVGGSVNGITYTGSIVSSVDNSATNLELVLNHYNDTSLTGALLYGARSRGTFALPTVVQDNDNLIDIYAAGNDGTDWALSSAIRMEVDGTPGNDDMPGRIVFETSADGGQTPIEAMRINSSQNVNFKQKIASRNKSDHTIAYLNNDNVLVSEWGDNLTTSTFSSETTNVINGAASYEIAVVTAEAGYVNSPSITLEPEHQDNLIAVKFKYTYDGDNGDMRAYLYDVTNSVELGEIYLQASTTVKGAVAYGNTATDTASVQLRFEAVTVNNGKLLVFDSVEFTDDPLVTAAISNTTEWEDYIPTLTGVGTPTNVSCQYRRVGDSAEIRGSFTAGTPTAVGMRIGLPSGLNLDTVKAPHNSTRNRLGTGNRINSTTSLSAVDYPSTLIYNGTNTDSLAVSLAASSDTTLSTINGNSYLGAGDSFLFSMTVPIEGWSAYNDHILVSDTRQQAHFVGSIEWSTTSALGWGTTSTSFVDFSADPQGDDNPRTLLGAAQETSSLPGQYPRIRFADLKKGHYTISIGGEFERSHNGSTGAAQFRISDGTNVSSVGTINDSNGANIVNGPLVFDINLPSDQADVTFAVQARSSDGTSISKLSAITNTVRISVYYNPPEDEKTVVTTVALPMSEKQSFSARIANNGTATITSVDADWIDSVTRTGTGVVTVVYKPGIFTVLPALGCTPRQGSANPKYTCNIQTESMTGCVIQTGDGANANFDFDITLSADKQGADAADGERVYVGSFRPKQLMYIDVHATDYTSGVTSSTSYKTIPLVSLSGDIVASISSNAITFKKGMYDLRIRLGNNSAGWSDLQLYRTSGGAGQIKEFKNVVYASSYTAFNEIEDTLIFSEATTLEFRTKTDNGTGYEYFSRIAIEKRQ